MFNSRAAGVVMICQLVAGVSLSADDSAVLPALHVLDHLTRYPGAASISFGDPQQQSRDASR